MLRMSEIGLEAKVSETTFLGQFLSSFAVETLVQYFGKYTYHECQTCSRRPPWYPWVIFICIDMLLSVYKANLWGAATHCKHSTQRPKQGNYFPCSGPTVAECVPIEAE